MIAYVWRRTGDLDCSLCDENMRKHKGCVDKATHPHNRGPKELKVTMDVCPRRFIGDDVIELVEDFKLCGGNPGLSEIWSMPWPVREAWDLLSGLFRSRERLIGGRSQ